MTDTRKIPWMITPERLEVKISDQASKRLEEIVQYMEWPNIFAMRKIVNQFIHRINSQLEALKSGTIGFPIHEQKIAIARKIEIEYVDWLKKLSRLVDVPIDSLISQAILTYDLKQLDDFKVDCNALDKLLEEAAAPAQPTERN